MTATLAIAGIVLSTCSLDLAKIEIVTKAQIQEHVRCNFEGATVRIEGSTVIVEAP